MSLISRWCRRTAPEYFVFGDDVPESLYEAKLAEPTRDKMAFMFGGIGDGRNLLASLATIMADMGMGKLKRGSKSFHFTIVDIKPAVLARNILILQLLFDMVETPNTNSSASVNASMRCLYYTYLAPIMPAPVHDTLQQKIRDAIDRLENRKPMLPCLDVSADFRPDVLKVLREWQGEAGDDFPASKLRSSVVSQRALSDEQQKMRFGSLYQTTTPPGCEKQELFYRKTGILLLSSNPTGHAKELQRAYELFDPSKPDEFEKGFLKAVDASWKTNPTMIDLHWERGRDAHPSDSTLAHDPFSLGDGLHMGGFALPDKTHGLFGMLKPFFFAAATAIAQLGDKLKIEACVGDITSILEQIRYGVVGHRQQADVTDSDSDDPPISVPGQDTDDYPSKYDRIHLSNIPDYVGGNLTTFLYGLSMLHPGNMSSVTASCLRNPNRFKSFAHYNNEYTLLNTATDLHKVFQVRMRELDEHEKSNPFPLTNYVHWYHDPLPQSSTSLMQRHQLETWLFRLFFKIVIPKDRTPRNFSLIYSPLNLTTFFRVCAHLHAVGYPAHWMNGILDEIYSGKVTTKARPPRSEPLLIKEVRADRQALAQSTKPFVAEMATLGSLWQHALPFGVTSRVTPIDQIHEYTIKFDDVNDAFTETPVFVLCLFSARFLTPDIQSIRPFVLDDEEADKSDKAGRIRENLHIITTWNWSWEEKTGTFWMKKEIMDDVRRNPDWAITIWRTDVWTYQSMPQPLTEVKDAGPFWARKGAPTPDPD